MEQTARSFLRAGLAGFALIATTAPAFAQDWSLRAFDKSEAILGGPSSLAAIIAAQSGGTALAASLPLTNAVLRPAPLFAPAPFTPQVEAASDTVAALDRPDVFNSIAMPIDRTPLDKNWSRVGSASVSGRAARFAAALRGRDEQTKLVAVNRFVNARITFVDDIRQYGVADRWSAANESLSRGRGDCEDYAIAKLAMLRSAGFSDRDLYVVVLRDLSRRADHAVLVVRSGGRFLVLDNGTDRMIDSAAIADYRPMLTFAAGQRFAHGYRRSAAPQVIVASNKVTSDPAPMTLAATAGMPSSPFASR